MGDFVSLADVAVEVESDKDYPVAGIYSFGRGLINRGTIRGQDTQYRVLHRVSTGSVVFAKLNAWEGAIAVVPDEFDGYHLSPEFPVFSVNESRCDLAYLRHLLAWPRLWEQMTPRGSMIRRKRTTPLTFSEARVPLPPIAEQRRVADILDRLMEAVTRSERVRELEAATRAALLRSLLRLDAKNRRSLGEVLTLSDVTIHVQADRTYRMAGIYSFGRGLIERGVINGDETKYRSLHRVSEGSVVFAKLNAWEGALALVPTEFDGHHLSPEFPVLMVDESSCDPAYLRHILRWPSLWDQMAPRGSMIRRKRTTTAAFLTAEVPIPPIAEQRRVAGILDTFAAVTVASDRARDLAGALRESALNAAFSGGL